MTITSAQLHQSARAFDDAALLERTAGRRDIAARLNIAAQSCRDAASDIARVERGMSERGLPLAFKRDTLGQQIGLAVGFVLFVLALIFWSGMQ